MARSSRHPGLIVVLGLLPALGCRGRPAPDIILVSLDTVRADHLSVYGYSRPTTPNLEGFAREAAVFEQAFTPIPWTVGAHMSLLTALYPTVHNVAHLEPQSDVPRTATEALREAGYRTGGFVHPILDQGYGFAKGFDDYFRPVAERRAEFMLGRALRWVEDGEKGKDAGRPFFLFVHLYDAHYPYDPPAPFDATFGPAQAREANRIAQAHPYKQDKTLSEEELRQVVALYDGEIAYVDNALGGFFRKLKELGVYERALIVVTADHGEGFLEHGLLNHGNSVYEELIRVPLLARFPGGRFAGRRTRELVELVDVAPTALELGRARPLPAAQGRSLRERLEKKGATGAASAYASGAFASCLRSEDWKLIENPASRVPMIPRARPGELELYDLRRDPQERHDLAPERAHTVRAMASALHRLDEENRRLRQRLREGRDVRTLELSEEQRERLRALGYVE